jgi:hypothetical protein
MCVVLASSAHQPTPTHPNQPESNQEWRLRLTYLLLETLGSLRTADMFDAVVDYPDSAPAVEDLAHCLAHTVGMGGRERERGIERDRDSPYVFPQTFPALSHTPNPPPRPRPPRTSPPPLRAASAPPSGRACCTPAPPPPTSSIPTSRRSGRCTRWTPAVGHWSHVDNRHKRYTSARTRRTPHRNPVHLSHFPWLSVSQHPPHPIPPHPRRPPGGCGRAREGLPAPPPRHHPRHSVSADRRWAVATT